MSASRSVVLVDVYGPTMRLMRAFADAGCRVVRVQSTPEVPPSYQPGFDPDAFDTNIVHTGEFAALAAAVGEHEPVAVLTAGELGVELADALAEALGLPGNGTALSEARRNKYGQNEALRAAGVPAARQLLVSSAEELELWHEELGGRVVVKPVRSMGNDGVSFCDTPLDSVAAYKALHGHPNTFDIINEGVVAQEYLTGVEYAVDTASCRGCHRVTDIWQYTKINVNGVVDRMAGHFTVAPENPVWPVLAGYAQQVLDALGVGYGPAHLEVIVTDDGPRLVEGGFRIAGASVPFYAELAAGESQITWTLDAYLDPDRFVAEHQRPYRLVNHVAQAFPTSPVSGVLRSYPGLEAVRRLESFHSVIEHVSPGQRLDRTVCNSTEPLIIALAHPRPEVVASDLASVNYLDGPGFYDVEGDTP